MALPSPSYTITLRVEVPASQRATSTVVSAVAEAGAAVMGVDIVHSSTTKLTVDVTCDTVDGEHGERVRDALNALEGVQVLKMSDSTFLMHLGGKIEVALKVPLKTRRDLSRAYTPGVARVCLAIAEKPEDARRLTIKRNTVAVVTDGTAVLGLGDIGPAAALPVMEGKAALFKEFGHVDAWPVCLDTKDTEEIISIVKAIAPVYGGINLEDISAPRCFEIEARLREELDIPVFHDDQHGTAIVVLAALINALKVTGKTMADVRIVVSGVGAAGSAIIKLLKAQGARDIVAFGRGGALHRGATNGDEHRRWIAENTNEAGFTGTLKEGLVGADVFIGVSAGNILTGEDVVLAMETAWLTSDPEAPLARRLLEALTAGDLAGGDSRGRQSAALLVVREGAGYGGLDDIAADLRVDDHESPIPELARLLALSELYLTASTEAEQVPVTPELEAELEAFARAQGARDFQAWVGTENYEMRVSPELAWIDQRILDIVRSTPERP